MSGPGGSRRLRATLHEGGDEGVEVVAGEQAIGEGGRPMPVTSASEQGCGLMVSDAAAVVTEPHGADTRQSYDPTSLDCTLLSARIWNWADGLAAT